MCNRGDTAGRFVADNIFMNMITDFVKTACAAARWQVSGNNIHRLPGVELLSTGPGCLQTVFGQSLHIVDDVFVVLALSHTVAADGRFTWHHTEVARFDTLAGVLVWLGAHGCVSDGGRSHIPGRFLTA